MAPQAPPAGFSPTAARLAALLAPHTPFAEAIVRRQAERAGLSVSSMTEDDVAKIAPLLVAASSPFVDPPVLAKLKRELEALRGR